MAWIGHDYVYVRQTPKPVLYCEGSDEPKELPTRWQICPECSGEGKTSLHLGAFTGSEWNELDREEREAIRAGDYAKTCEECSGSGKVKVVDRERLSPEELAAWEAQVEDLAEQTAERLSEMRMGC